MIVLAGSSEDVQALAWNAAGIADHMESFVDSGAADGFNIMAPTLPSGLEDFIRIVLPELRRRADIERSVLKRPSVGIWGCESFPWVGLVMLAVM